MEIIIRRVGMEDHINIVKLFQVSKLKNSRILEKTRKSFYSFGNPVYVYLGITYGYQHVDMYVVNFCMFECYQTVNIYKPWTIVFQHSIIR